MGEEGRHEESGDEERYEGEGDESNEEKGNESQQDRQGQACASFGLPRNQGEDSERLGEVGYDEEQVRQDREQEGIRRFQEEVCHQRAEEVVRCMQEGAQGARNQRLLPCRRQNRARKGAVRQGEVASRLSFGTLASVLPSDMLASFFSRTAVCASGVCTLGLRAIAVGIQRPSS